MAAGASFAERDLFEMTALMHAGPSPAMVRYLIQKGADPNAATNRGHTALDYFDQDQHQESAAILRKHGGKHGHLEHHPDRCGWDATNRPSGS